MPWKQLDNYGAACFDYLWAEETSACGVYPDGKKGYVMAYLSSLQPAQQGAAWLLRARALVESTKNLQDNWNGYGSEAPNDVARSHAARALDLLAEMGFAPLNVGASAENGVGISFCQGARYALIEFYNEGDMGAVVSKGPGHADSWDVLPSELKKALEKIHDHIHGALA
jgi:hypothetical protein